MTHATSQNPPLDIGVPFSFEVYPPRKPELRDVLHQTIGTLAAAGPAFISVTYGAGGSSRDATLECVSHILAHTTVEPMAHLTCVQSTLAESTALVRDFMDVGVKKFLALRGDPPEGSTESDEFLGDLRSATELVELIRELQDPAEPVSIGVAAFPNGHPQSTSVQQDIDTLLAKQAAGADMAITQLFFNAPEYINFVAQAKAAGVHIPILPGIMPVISPARLSRMVEISGEEIPRDLEAALLSTDSAEEQREIGIEHAANLARELIAGGAPGIHLYAFNQSGPVLEVLQRLS